MSAIRMFFAIVGVLAISGMVASEIDAALFRVFGYGADSTDTAHRRSGLGLHTDALTGCQYLASPWGGLTPRMGRDGRQLCLTPPSDQEGG